MIWDNNCEKCKWWDPGDEGDSGFGYCRATLPQPVSRLSGEEEFEAHGYWMLTHSIDYCRFWEQDVDRITVPDDLPYNFHVDSTSSAREGWWGRATPLRSGLRYLYIDHTGLLLASLAGPPRP